MCVLGEKVGTYSEDGVVMNGEVKLELEVSECEEEAARPVVVSPSSVDDVLVPSVICRRSRRTAKRRSLLLPGELAEDAASAVGTYRRKLSEPVKDSVENGDNFMTSRVIEVKPPASPSRRKRSNRHRKPAGEKSSSAVVRNSSTSVDEILGRLVNTFCGTNGHPENCQDCKNRVDAIRALLQSSGKCQDTNSANDPDTTPSISADSQEPSDAKTVGLFCCSKCSDRFDTFDELQKHEQLHSAGRKKCSVCHRYLAAGTSMAVVSGCLITCISVKQERPAVADKPARRLRNICTVYVRAVGL